MSNCAIKLKNHVSKEVKIVAPQIASNFVSTANVGLGSDYIEVKFESREVGDSQQYPLQAANELAKQIKSTYPELSKNIDIRNSTIKNAKILIFGNEDVCPNDYNLFQPYIIAESFMATKIE